MRIHTFNGEQYCVPNELTDFQLEMYVHLIDWKRENLTKEAAEYRGQLYDALLPVPIARQGYPLYPPIVDRFREHQRAFLFKYHRFFGHMASSQAACANLFLPILKDPDSAATILSSAKPDLHRIATECLDYGFRIEFWDDPYGMLNDHNQAAGTDSDIAIAYYTGDGELCLWLIEHKLTEKEFTPCGGFRSKGRKCAHKCESVEEIVANPDLCYCHSIRGHRHWDITLRHPDEFPVDRLLSSVDCPFKGGMNQLWRNYLLALAVEGSEKWLYKRVYFSVVYHPNNPALGPSMSSFEELLGNRSRFSRIPSSILTNAAKVIDDSYTRAWLSWYEGLYYF